MADILVVDDESAVREALVSHLERFGHRCTQADNGLEALERLHASEFDLILSDVMMPQLNGFQLLSRLLPFIEGRIPFVILSSVADAEGIEAALHVGVFDYLAKPAEPEELRRVVELGLARRAEFLRMKGRLRRTGGPVPAAALGPREDEFDEASPEQAPAGVPALRDEKRQVSVAPPDDRDGGLRPTVREGPEHLSLWDRLRLFLGRDINAA